MLTIKRWSTVYRTDALIQWGVRRTFPLYCNKIRADFQYFHTEFLLLYCTKWGDGQSWENHSVEGPHEANLLKLDCSKLKKVFGWKPVWNIDTAIEKTVEFTKSGTDMRSISNVMKSQIDEFATGFGK